ncbi:hypothetical protein [Streptomyces virginiae]|nr:hypothetical protein [Streptomyces virginiae]MCX4960597.1 hypothetical protein [Streptomyces virginiae]
MADTDVNTDIGGTAKNASTLAGIHYVRNAQKLTHLATETSPTLR